jgi:hypothetical protein
MIKKEETIENEQDDTYTDDFSLVRESVDDKVQRFLDWNALTGRILEKINMSALQNQKSLEKESLVSSIKEIALTDSIYSGGKKESIIKKRTEDSFYNSGIKQKEDVFHRNMSKLSNEAIEKQFVESKEINE